ncbi:MAG: rhomboid family intramembrane serine protease [Acidobacteriota bacterium]
MDEKQENHSENKLERGPILTWIVSIISVCIFVGLLQERDNQSWEAVSAWGYFPPDAIWDGKYWALLTSVFVHIEPLHLLFNLYWLWVLGGAVERAIGSAKWIIFFIAAAVISSGIQFATSSTTGIGLSGVVYGLFGFIWISKAHFSAFEKILPKQTVAMFIAWAFLCILLTLLKIWNIANEAHFAGLLFGICIAYLFILKYKVRLMLTGLIVLTMLAIMPLFWCPWSAIWVSKQGIDAYNKGNYQSAINWYQKSLRQGQDPVWAWSNIALAYKAMGNDQQFNEAIEQLRKLDSGRAKEIEDSFIENKKE